MALAVTALIVAAVALVCGVPPAAAASAAQRADVVIVLPLQYHPARLASAAADARPASPGATVFDRGKSFWPPYGGLVGVTLLCLVEAVLITVLLFESPFEGPESSHGPAPSRLRPRSHWRPVRRPGCCEAGMKSFDPDVAWRRMDRGATAR